jgi:hypothetical protein
MLSSAKGSAKKWQLQQGIRNELSSGVGCCSKELRESHELSVGRIIEKKQHERD